MHTILVIDDDDSVRGTVVSGLRKNRFNVLEARSGAEGIEIARKEAPALVLCDLNMDQADGKTTLALLRKIPATADVPFVLMTGQPEECSYADGVLVKPFTLTALLASIRKHLRQSKKRPSGKNQRGSRARRQKIQQNSPPPSLNSQQSGGIKPSPEQLEELLARVQALREQERDQVARAIHDDLTQKLTVLAIGLSLFDSSLNSNPEGLTAAECAETVRKLAGLVNELIDSAQEITAQLRPKVLDEFGLVAALEWLTQRFQKTTGIKCELRVKGTEGVLKPSVAVELYRLSQEILSSVAEHAQTSSIAICVERRAGDLCMDIRDHCSGNGSQRMSHPAPLALLAMRGRTEHLGGTFDVKNRPGEGTTMSVRIPLRERI